MRDEDELLHLANQFAVGEKAAWDRLVSLALAESAPAPVGSVTTRQGEKLSVCRLSLPLLVRLLAQPGQPSYMEVARCYTYGGFSRPEDFLVTEIRAADGRSFDIRNQYEHSWVVLAPSNGVAGFHLINWNPGVSYGRLLVAHPRYWGEGLGPLLIGLQAEEAWHGGLALVRHKVNKDNHLFVNLLKRMGHTKFADAQGAAAFWLVESPVEPILLVAERLGYRRLLDGR